uniref:Secreted protein n=1 Tax=Schistosoma japonicum TaxID=6182 RepID=Q5BZ07_SCHJA|nr:unknown [Schistosoma japonicum]
MCCTIWLLIIPMIVAYTQGHSTVLTAETSSMPYLIKTSDYFERINYLTTRCTDFFRVHHSVRNLCCYLVLFAINDVS